MEHARLRRLRPRGPLYGEELTVLEANAIPGLTDTSLLPLAAEAAGIGFDDFVARVLDLAVAQAPA